MVVHVLQWHHLVWRHCALNMFAKKDEKNLVKSKAGEFGFKVNCMKELLGRVTINLYYMIQP